jgi:Mrp family chromosome partitioning ATPase
MCVVGDASTLSASVDGLIVVVRLGIVDRGAVRDLKRQLVASRAPTIGFAIAGVEKTEAYGYYGSPKSSGEQRLPSPNGAGADVPSGVGPAPG